MSVKILIHPDLGVSNSWQKHLDLLEILQDVSPLVQKGSFNSN